MDADRDALAEARELVTEYMEAVQAAESIDTATGAATETA